MAKKSSTKKSKAKEKTLSKLRRKIFIQAQEEPSVPEMEELEHKISEDSREISEGDIEEEEEAGSEPYFEIEKELEHEDNPDEEDEED